MRGAPWVKSLKQKHSSGVDKLIAIFMNSYWKEGVRHWGGQLGILAGGPS
jgi:hypothetical protein